MSADARAILQSKWRAQRVGPFFEVQTALDGEMTRLLPGDYLSLIPDFGGMEGFLGSTYLRLYQLGEVFSANLAYELPTFFPECFLFGTDGGGEAFGFLLETGQVIRVPFIPLSKDHADLMAPSFSEFILWLGASGESQNSDPDTLGMEIHEVKPIVFGGSPTDENNKAPIPPERHAEITRFWNNLYRRLRAAQQP